MKEIISKCIEIVSQSKKTIAPSLVIYLHCYEKGNKDQKAWFGVVPVFGLLGLITQLIFVRF